MERTMASLRNGKLLWYMSRDPQKNNEILKNNSDRTIINSDQDYYDPIEYGIRYLIECYILNRNDLVLDPFLGNGEVLRIAKS